MQYSCFSWVRLSNRGLWEDGTKEEPRLSGEVGLLRHTSGYDSVLPLQTILVRSLALGSHVLQGGVAKINKRLSVEALETPGAEGQQEKGPWEQG